MGRDDEKRMIRELKRDMKKAGNKRVRRITRITLEENPEEATELEEDYGRFGTAPLNGMFRTPRKK